MRTAGFCAVVLASLCSLASADEPTLTVMSYNLRYASDSGSNSWPSRRPILKNCIEQHHPDIIGTQEGLYPQLKDVGNDLSGYRWIGLGREGGSKGEFMAIFYRPERLEPLEYDHYWLSDTPEVIGSSTWGNSVRRMVTWVRFRDKQADREFYFINTHFDHQVEKARRKSAELLLDRSQKLDKDLPVIVTGDFNSAAESSKAYETLVGEGRFVDTWSVAEHKGSQVRSFNGFRYPAPEEGARIDWILTRGPIRAVEIEIDAYHEGQQYPSDHFPVIATLRYGP